MSEQEYIEETLSARLYDASAPLLVAVDGRCACGKTALAARLGDFFGAPVFHTDDFYLPFSARTTERLRQAGGHMDVERMEKTLSKAARGEALTYQAYNPHAEAYGPELAVPPQKLYIVEGAYALLPPLEEFYGYKIFLTADPHIQRARLLAREGEEKLKVFLSRWIPAEEAYFAACDVRSRADAAFDTSDWW